MGNPKANRKKVGSVKQKFVYRLQPGDGHGRTFEIGECNAPRSFPRMWCDRRVCEGFWGDEKLCQQTVKSMNGARK